jgi:hypothetical protein
LPFDSRKSSELTLRSKWSSMCCPRLVTMGCPHAGAHGLFDESWIWAYRRGIMPSTAFVAGRKRAEAGHQDDAQNLRVPLFRGRERYASIHDRASPRPA